MERLHGDVGGDIAARVCVGLLVAALHLAVLILILTSSHRPETAGADSRALVLVNVEAAERTLPEIPRDEVAPEPEMRPLPGSSAINVPSPNDSAAPADPAAIRDWRGSMDAAVVAAVGKAIKEQGYQPLGPVGRNRAGSSSPPIFETPRRKAGDIDHDAVGGRTLIWHNEHCFTELRFPTIKDPNALVGAPNPPKCMQSIGERAARGDLFESMKAP